MDSRFRPQDQKVKFIFFHMSLQNGKSYLVVSRVITRDLFFQDRTQHCEGRKLEKVEQL